MDQNSSKKDEYIIQRDRWHSRFYLPHFDGSDSIQHVTFHLADGLPQRVLEKWKEELKSIPKEKQSVEFRTRVENWIDAGHGSCILKYPAIASMVEGALLYFDIERYQLLAWSIMPNHVHVLFQPINGWAVSKIVASWKKFTARSILDYLRNSSAERGIADSDNLEVLKPVWQREYWDRFIRNEKHFNRAVEYIHENPVKAGLVVAAEEWRWGSAWKGRKADK